MQTRHTQSTVARPVAPPRSRSGQRPVEKPVDFALHMPEARTAAIAGTFNNWDPTRTQMNKNPIGNWKATVWLPPGRYEYRFVVDGQWLSDPNTKESVANAFGTTNSVLKV